MPKSTKSSSSASTLGSDLTQAIAQNDLPRVQQLIQNSSTEQLHYCFGISSSSDDNHQNSTIFLADPKNKYTLFMKAVLPPPYGVNIGRPFNPEDQIKIVNLLLSTILKLGDQRLLREHLGHTDVYGNTVLYLTLQLPKLHHRLQRAVLDAYKHTGDLQFLIDQIEGRAVLKTNTDDEVDERKKVMPLFWLVSGFSNAGDSPRLLLEQYLNFIIIAGGDDLLRRQLDFVNFNRVRMVHHIVICGGQHDNLVEDVFRHLKRLSNGDDSYLRHHLTAPSGSLGENLIGTAMHGWASLATVEYIFKLTTDVGGEELLCQTLCHKADESGSSSYAIRFLFANFYTPLEVIEYVVGTIRRVCGNEVLRDMLQHQDLPRVASILHNVVFFLSGRNNAQVVYLCQMLKEFDLFDEQMEGLDKAGKKKLEAILGTSDKKSSSTTTASTKKKTETSKNKQAKKETNNKKKAPAAATSKAVRGKKKK